MSDQLQTVLQIALVGSALLFIALAGLIGLMYLLTARRLSGSTHAPTGDPPLTVKSPDTRAEEEAEEERQRHAVALAVAVACAESARPVTIALEAPSAWRRLHRVRRLNQRTARAKVRS